jgi:acyl carrier protein
VTTSAEQSATVEAVAQEIISLVQAQIGPVDISADSTFEDQAVDSFGVMALVFKIEALYDITLDEEDSDDLRTVGDLASLVVRRIEECR